MNLNPWLRCTACQRIHVRRWIGPRSVCACGVDLWPIAWEVSS